MPTHDQYARVTPYERAFPDLVWARERFAQIRDEALVRDVDPGDPVAFALLGSVGQTLRDLRDPQGESEPIHGHASLLFHAYQLWLADEPLILLDTAAARLLVEWPAESAPPRHLVLEAGYAQLPQHLFWMRTGADGLPESVDGFFWAVPSGRDELSLLLANGLQKGRTGFSIVPVPTSPLSSVGSWMDAPGRSEGPDFASDLPGARLDGLYEVRTGGEALKLVARMMAAIDASPGRLKAAATPSPSTGPPRPSALRYRRLVLG